MSAEIIKLSQRRSKTRRRKTAPEPGSLEAIMASLPFLVKNKPRGTGYTYWSVTATGNYGADYDEGMLLARKYLPALRYFGGTVMLGSIVLGMMAAGYKEEEKGLVLGFMRVIAEHCAAGVMALALLDGDCPPQGAG